MLWKWLGKIFRWAILFVLPHNPPRLRINPNDPCPACGNVGSELKFERVQIADSKEEGAMVRKTCKTCSFAHYEIPVSAPKYPAV